MFSNIIHSIDQVFNILSTYFYAKIQLKNVKRFQTRYRIQNHLSKSQRNVTIFIVLYQATKKTCSFFLLELIKHTPLSISLIDLVLAYLVFQQGLGQKSAVSPFSHPQVFVLSFRSLRCILQICIHLNNAIDYQSYRINQMKQNKNVTWHLLDENNKRIALKTYHGYEIVLQMK